MRGLLTVRKLQYSKVQSGESLLSNNRFKLKLITKTNLSLLYLYQIVTGIHGGRKIGDWERAEWIWVQKNCARSDPPYLPTSKPSGILLCHTQGKITFIYQVSCTSVQCLHWVVLGTCLGWVLSGKFLARAYSVYTGWCWVDNMSWWHDMTTWQQEVATYIVSIFFISVS